MNKPFQQLFFCFFLLITLYFALSCSTARELPPGQIYSIPSWKNLYIFHSGDSTWIVKPVPAAGNRYSAIVFEPGLIKKNRQVHIFAEPPASVTIKDGILSVPMDNIVRVENYKISAGTVLLCVGVVALLFLMPLYL